MLNNKKINLDQKNIINFVNVKTLSISMIIISLTIVGAFFFLASVLNIFWGLSYFLYSFIFEVPVTFWYGIFLHFLSFSAILLSILVSIFRNPVYSLLCLIGVFFHVILFLLSLKIEFLALIFLIIYVGAIAILFLFVIMMFNLKELALSSLKLSSKRKVNILFLSLFLFPLIKFYFILENFIFLFLSNHILLNPNFFIKSLDLNYFITYQYSDIFIFSHLLYSYFSVLFILSSFILFAAMISAIILALSTIEELGPKIQ